MRGRGGTVENIKFDNLIIENTRLEAIMINMNYHATEEEPVSDRTPVLKDIFISNVTIRNAAKIMKIEGLRESPVRGVYLNNVVAHGREGVVIDYGKNVRFLNCSFSQSQGKRYQVQHSNEVYY